MDDDHSFPTDLAECHRLLLAAFQQAAELSRVLDETAASYDELQATHQVALEELSALKRWIYGRRTEKIVEGEGQCHLFDLEPSNATTTLLEPKPELSRPATTGRRRRRELDLDKLPHFRHEQDLAKRTSSAPAAAAPKTALARMRARSWSTSPQSSKCTSTCDPSTPAGTAKMA